MILSSKKLAFIHIPKTGGTSIETNIIGHSNPEDTKHLTATQMKQHINEQQPDEWNNYHKFTVIRNPWDLVVSWWRWRVKQAKEKQAWCEDTSQGFNTFLANHPDIIPGHYLNYFDPGLTYMDYISINDKVIVDTILRFENLQDDWCLFIEKLKLPFNSKLPHINKTQRKHYSYYYDKHTVDLVYRKFQKEIDMFDYEFETKKV